VEISRRRLINKLDFMKNCIISEMETGRLEWLSHVIRLEDFRLSQKILNAKLDKHRIFGGTDLSWFDDVQSNKKTLLIKR
jgi:hypothetical protein